MLGHGRDTCSRNKVGFLLNHSIAKVEKVMVGNAIISDCSLTSWLLRPTFECSRGNGHIGSVTARVSEMHAFVWPSTSCAQVLLASAQV